MGVLNHEIRRGIAWVQFDSGGMNTLSRAAIEELGSLREECVHHIGKNKRILMVSYCQYPISWQTPIQIHFHSLIP